MIELPTIFIDTMQEQLGDSYKGFEQCLQSDSPTSIRLHPHKTAKLQLGYDKIVPWNMYGRYLKDRPSFTHDPLFQAGAYYVQEASSMALSAALESIDKSGPIRVLDLCGAPGGKSTLILDFLTMRNQVGDYLVCNEVIKSRANILADNIVKWGYSNVMVCSHDPKFLADKLGTFFDIILADCPCSGEGLFRKDANARNEWSVDNVQLCDLRQKRILHEADRLLKPGGHIIYSTCTYNSIENIDQVRDLAIKYDYESQAINSLQNLGVVEKISQGAIGYQFYPHLQLGEGFFISLMHKRTGTSQASIKVKTNKRQKTRKVHLDFIPSNYSIVESKLGTLHAMEATIEKDFSYLAKILYLKSMGTEIGMMKNKDFIPSHAFAMSFELSAPFEKIEIEKETAIEFMMKNPIELNSTEGWKLICYKDLGLGWIKKLKNRVNNYYPKNMRIMHRER